MNNPFDVRDTDEILPALEKENQGLVPLGAVTERPAAVTPDGIHFVFPEAADISFSIYGKRYQIHPSSLLICPEDWAADANSMSLDQSIEASDSWRFAIFEAYIQAESQATLFEEQQKIVWSPRRMESERKVFESRKEAVKAGLRKEVGNTATIADIESMLVTLYGNEWIVYQTEKARIDAEVKRLKNLHDIISFRVSRLDSISNRLSKDRFSKQK